MQIDALLPLLFITLPPARAFDEVVAPEQGLVVGVVVQRADLLLGCCEGDGLDVVCAFCVISKRLLFGLCALKR